MMYVMVLCDEQWSEARPAFGKVKKNDGVSEEGRKIGALIGGRVQ